MPKGKYRTARNVGFSSERLAPCIYRILAARAYFHGSSPRMWGTLRLRRQLADHLRFIPTHVGNTPRRSCCCRTRTVHPHARGEHRMSWSTSRRAAGSSPRTWGTQQLSGKVQGRWRFIPTHVGNTPGRTVDATGLPVHPHARGEHRRIPSSSPWSAGSSPRTWGTHLAGREVRVLDRFIPTHVGNTGGMCDGRFRTPVHPHTRGEHDRRLDLSKRRLGSSPRTWGTRTRCCRVGYPAPVHPHARGEHCSTVHPNAMSRGSSPRTWGTRATGRQRRTGRRFIPTHVGNTLDSFPRSET
ncbi:Domain of uncharacterised function (DUF2825) [Pseudomonas aeruginosa]|nr:Domain of uncharacterised function (DUF2825) [Pseudomonas aeruginosa]